MKLPIPKLKINQNGFTLMEVMVSVSIFAIIITIGIGSLLTIYSTLQKTRADQQTIDSLSYVLDTMTRRVRTGHTYTGGGDSISFIDQAENESGGDLITYYLQQDQNGVKRLYVTESDGQQYDITPQNISIDAFNVTIFGGTSGTGGGQPMVEFQLQGTVKNGKNESPLAIQTTTSQRPFDTGISPSGLGSNNTTGDTVGDTPPLTAPTEILNPRQSPMEIPRRTNPRNTSNGTPTPAIIELAPITETTDTLFVR
jgi:prepilin-type N-terminal cleavage/methylation domain-containing protein